MRKNVLALSIATMIGGFGLVSGASAAVFAPAASATAADTFAVSPTGIGNTLIVPYFSTQSGNSTLLNIVNTDTANGKAVKVRFRGASNSDDIFDFQLYLSPADVWTANLSQGADGRSVLSTSDKTCTLPATVATTANAFDTSRLPASFTADQKAAETREGYVEIFTMANVPKALQNGQFATNPSITNNPLWDAIKHVSGVAPCTTAVMGLLANEPTIDISVSAPGTSAPAGEAASGGQGGSASAMGLTVPTGSLFANYTVINVPKTLAFAGEAIALSATVAATGKPAVSALAFYPQTSVVTRGTAIAYGSAETSDPLLLTGANGDVTGARAGLAGAAITAGVVTARQFDLPDLSTPMIQASVAGTSGNAVVTLLTGTTGNSAIKFAETLSSALTAVSVANEQLGNTSILANTDWTFSMPTRRYHMAMNYGWNLAGNVAFNSALDGRVFTTRTASTGAVLFDTTNTSVNTAAGKTHQICTAASSIKSWDREETTSSSGFVISPAVSATVQFCGEVSVLSFNAGGDTQPSVLGATLARQDVTTAFLDGWTSIAIPGLSSRGLPVVGRSYIKAQNGGVFFGIGANHRYVRP